jgi:hypothetical protein
VLEMRSYMRDAEGTNSREPISRISRWEDTNGDGVYDKHTVFADHLVMPRVAFPLLDGELLVLQTDSRELQKFTDTNGDGVADKREVFYSGFGRVQNMEWQPGGLTWALDNWLYSTYNPHRLRIAGAAKSCARRPSPTAVSGGPRRTTTARCGGSTAAASSGPSTFSSRFKMVPSTRPTTSSPVSGPQRRAHVRRRHAGGRHESRPRAGWIAESFHRGRRGGDLSRRSAAEGHDRRPFL